MIAPCNFPDVPSPESFSLGTFFSAPDANENAAIEASGLVI